MSCHRNDALGTSVSSYTNNSPYPSFPTSTNSDPTVPDTSYSIQPQAANMDLTKRTNDAINANGNHFVNGATSDIAITTHGSDWYFVS